jgi:hypothetical protein
MGTTRKKSQCQQNCKGKHIGPNKLHVDGIKKMAMKGRKYERRNLDGRKLPWRRYMMIIVDKEERCPFRMTLLYFKKKDGFFYRSRHGLGCEHKGHSKKAKVKTSAAHTKKLKLKTAKATWFNHPLRQGEQQVSLKTYSKKIQQNKSNEKSPKEYNNDIQSRRARLGFQKYHLCYKTMVINHLTLTTKIRFVILIHDPTTSMFNEFANRQRGVIGDSES